MRTTVMSARVDNRACCRAVLLSVALSSIGCLDSKNVALVKEKHHAAAETLKLLKSVTDTESAKRVLPQIRPVYRRLSTAEAAVILASNREGELKMTKSHASELETRHLDLQKQLKQETDRISTINALPVEFWNRLRVASYELVVESLEAADEAGSLTDLKMLYKVRRVRRFYKEHGPEQVVEIKLETEVPISSAVPRVLKTLKLCAGGHAEAVSIADPGQEHGHLIAVAPVTDYELFMRNIWFARVRIERLEQRSVELVMRNVFSDQAVQQKAARNELNICKEAGGDIYYAWLAAELRNKTSSIAMEIRKTLAEMDPEAITNLAIRREIADAFFQLADDPTPKDFTDNYFPYLNYVTPYAKWKGVEAMPFVVERIDSSIAHLEMLDARVESPPLEALVSIGNTEAAVQLVRYVNEKGRPQVRSGFIKYAPIGSRAVDCLRNIGTVAERPVLDALAAEQIPPNSKVLNVLAAVGTNASIPILTEQIQTKRGDYELNRHRIEIILERGGKPVEAKKP